MGIRNFGSQVSAVRYLVQVFRFGCRCRACGWPGRSALP